MEKTGKTAHVCSEINATLRLRQRSFLLEQVIWTFAAGQAEGNEWLEEGPALRFTSVSLLQGSDDFTRD